VLLALHIALQVNCGVCPAMNTAFIARGAPLLQDMQDNLSASLEKTGLSKEAAAGISQAVAQATALTLGAGVGGAQGGSMALNVDANNRQLHPTEIQWIKANASTFAKQLSKDLGREVSTQEAMLWLTAAGESDVDANAQRSNGMFVRGTSNTEEAQAYDAAKAFITTSTKTNSGFIDANGQSQTLFTAKNGDFYKPQIYSEYRNDPQYRDYYWSVMGINLKGDNMSPQEKEVYERRQSIANKEAAKQLLTLGVQVIAGKVAIGTAAKISASKTSIDEFTPAPNKSTQPTKDGEFGTLGLTNVDPMRLPDGVKMVNELQKTGMSFEAAKAKAMEFISSGVTPPVATPLDVTDKLVKIVPVGGQPSASTGYWMRESELTKLKTDPFSMANKLGLPPGMQVNEFDVYQITPRTVAVAFESKIAPTTVNGIPDTTGGAKQTIVVDRNQFTPPIKTGSIKVN
jgi:hypothetical protein